MPSRERTTGAWSPSTLYKEEAKVGDARERTLRTAYDLFSAHGISACGIDRVIDEAGVAKMTLYRHFGSKDELVLAVLDRREERWTRGWLEEEIRRRARTPTNRLLACFDVLADWFAHEDFEGCLFLNTLVETHDISSPIGAACRVRLATVRGILAELADDAGVREPAEFASQWQLLMWGAILGASYDFRTAAPPARELGILLLKREGLAVR